jgi:hypothetical protein
MQGRDHKLAVVCKDVYSLNDINNAFIFAGADLRWLGNPPDVATGQRVNRVHAWIKGIERYAPAALNRVLTGVARALADDERVPENDRKFLRREYGLGDDASETVEDRSDRSTFPKSVNALIEQVIAQLPRAIHPLKHRRAGLPSLRFDNEYDVQDLLHALLRPWVQDIRAEEYTPSVGGKSTRIDFLLPKHKLVLEVKYVRDVTHGRNLGDELILDIAHYRVHPMCSELWVVVYDPQTHVKNPAGLQELEDRHTARNRSVVVRIFYLGLGHA